MTDFIPTEGRSVVYQIAEGEYRPAQIVKSWSNQPGGAANLVVFLDGSNDRIYGFDGSLTTWVTSRVLADTVGGYLPRKPEVIHAV